MPCEHFLQIMRTNRTVTHTATAKWNEPQPQAEHSIDSLAFAFVCSMFAQTFSRYRSCCCCCRSLVPCLNKYNPQYHFQFGYPFRYESVTLQLHFVHRSGKLIFHFAHSLAQPAYNCCVKYLLGSQESAHSHHTIKNNVHRIYWIAVK